jgi:hypothetical protein
MRVASLVEWRVLAQRTDVRVSMDEVDRLLRPYDLTLSLESQESFTSFTKAVISLVASGRMDAKTASKVNGLVSKILHIRDQG